MKTIKVKNPYIIPAKGEAYLKEVKIEVENDGIKMPNLTKKEKTETFGEVIFASPDEQFLVGKILVIDPWRVTPNNTLGDSYIRMDVTSYSELKGIINE